MMRFRGLLATAAAAAMMTATTAAAAPTSRYASPLVTRAATPAQDANQLGADVPRGTLISIGILALLVVIVLVSVGGDDDDTPNSP